jgi:hypothetical protein
MQPVVLALLLVSSCATIPAASLRPREKQEVAAHIVWHDTFRREDAPPFAVWFDGASLTCTDPKSGYPGFKLPDVPCHEGLTVSPFQFFAAWRDGVTFSSSPYTHEMAHVYLLRKYGLLKGADPDHTHERFPEVFGPGGLVEQGNANLQAEGL